MKKIAIIGCGASGTMVLANLIKRAKKDQKITITVFHSGTPLGRGIAYSTDIQGHLLNVVVGEMSAWSQDPKHFYNWLSNAYPGKYQEKSFAPRKIYGEYLQSIIENTKQLAKEKNIIVSFVNQELKQLPKGYGHICLALGNKLKKFEQQQNLKQVDLSKIKHIVIAGTGLSMVDQIIWLDQQNYRGKVTLISRGGNIPYAYSLQTQKQVPCEVQIGDDFPTVLKKYVNMVEKHKDWRSVIDSFRPISNQVWKKWSLEDKMKYLKQYRLQWNLRRHKIAQEIDQQIKQYFQKIQLKKISAGVKQATKKGDGYIVVLQNGDQVQCDAVVNCMGLDLNPKAHPIYQNLIKRGQICKSEVGSGVVPPKKNNGIHIIGSALIGHLFESVAVPDLCQHAANIARKILTKSSQQKQNL